jgi:eukaryotic-like serine/threonine-protein kinase
LLGGGIRQADIYMKYNLRYNFASQYIQTAISQFGKAKKTFATLEQLRSKRIIKGKASEETVLELKLKHTESAAVNNCQVAMMLLSGIPDQYKKTKKFNDARLSIIKERIGYALHIRDYIQTSELLSLLEKGAIIDSALIPESKQHKIEELRKMIRGNGSLTVSSFPEGAMVVLQKCELDKSGVLKESTPRKLGMTPLSLDSLSQGSYLLTLHKDGYPEIRNPIQIDHSEKEIVNVVIPEKIPDGMVYIPGGKFYIGGEHARSLRLREVEISAFFIKKYEVTFGEYIQFLKTVKDLGIRDEYLPMVRLKRSDRCFFKVVNSANSIIIPDLKADFPVVGISREAAVAYCDWIAEKTGSECRLPTAEEWEKAARGVDGRHFVWGNQMKNEYAFINENSSAKKQFAYFAPPGSFPRDTSVYGVCDMGGNVREWTASKFIDESPFFQIKGASASTSKRFLYCAYASDTPVVPSDVGFRYVFPVGKEK